MSKPKVHQQRKEKPRPPEAQALVSEELAFRSALADFAFLRVESPIDIFKSAFRLQDIKITFDSSKEAKLIFILILNEVEAIMARKQEVEPHIKNILKIINKEDLKKFESAVSGKIRASKKIADSFAFAQPPDDLVLQKMGRVLKKVVLRNSFFTAEAFGQVTEKNRQLMVKPNLFKDQEVALQFRNEVLEELKAYKNSKDKDKKTKMAKILVWPEKKELTGFEIRIAFSDQIGRQRAIYCHKFTEASMLKDNSIVRRTLDRDPNIKGKVFSLKTLWKVKRAEGFYKRHLQRLFLDSQINEKIFAFNEEFKNQLKGYQRQNLPNLYDSNYSPKDVYNFEDNSHMVFKKGLQQKTDEEKEQTDIDIIKRQLATIVSPEMYIRPDSGLLSDKKKRIFINSPFEQLFAPLDFNDAVFRDFVTTFRFDPKPLQISIPEKSIFIDQIVSNSKLLLQLKKILISNIFNWKEFPFETTEVDELIFEVQMFVEQGNYSSTSLSFISEVDPGYVVFDLQNSIKADLNSLKNLHVKIANKITEKCYFDQIIDIHGLLDAIYLENQISYEFAFEYKGFQCPASMYFTVVLLPRNLEIAHLTLTPKLIETNFDKFEHIVKASENFSDYRKNFYPASLKIPEQKLSDNYFYFMNCYFIRNNFALIKQENLFANSFRVSLTDGFVKLLVDISNREPNLTETLLNTSAKINSNEKLNINPYYDLVTRVSDLLCAKERLLLNSVVFKNQLKNYLNLAPKKEEFEFHKIMLQEINKALCDYFEQTSYIRPDHRAVIKKLVFEVYLHFENNEIGGKKYRIDFSTLYIPTIANIVQLNAFALKDKDLLLVIVTHILSNNYMKKFSDAGHLVHLDSAVIYLKLLFKSQYSDFYSGLQFFSKDLDTFILSQLMNSFAGLMNPISFAQFSDFKFLLLTFFMVHERTLHKLELLASIELTFSTLIDVLFLLTVFVSNSAYIKLHGQQANFASVLENAIRKESGLLRSNFSKIIELLDFALDRDLFAKDFKVLKDLLKTRHEPLIANYKSVAINLKTLGADEQLIKRIIDAEVSANSALKNRALALFSRSASGKEKESQKDKDEEDEATHLIEAEGKFIGEDIYFEILEDEELEAFAEVSEGNRSLPKYTSALVFLNNLDYSLIDSLAHNQKLVPDLNNIFELELEELNKFFMKYFQSSEAVKMELYNDLTGLTKTKKIPLLKLLVILCSCFADDPKETMECLEYLCASISQIYFPDEKLYLFNEAIKYVLDELNGLLPLTYFPRHLQQTIDAFERDLCCGIKSAKIGFGNDVIDVSEIVAKHFESNSFINKRPSLLCGTQLCNDLTAVFEDLISQNSGIDEFLRKFDITLEYKNKGEIEYLRIPFRIAFEGAVKVLCRLTKTIYFDNFVSERNLLSPSTLQNFLKASPFFYFNNLSALKLPFNFIGIPFSFKLKRKDPFLTIEAIFNLEEQTSLCAGLTPWKFQTENFQKLKELQNSLVNIDLNYTYFFLPAKQIFEVLCERLVECLSGQDMFKFIKLNKKDFVITTSKDKEVNENVFLFELTDFEKAIKTNETMFVVINYSQ